MAITVEEIFSKILKISEKYIFWEKNHFFLFSSLYYRHRLRKKNHQNPPYVRWKIFVFKARISAFEILIVRMWLSRNPPPPPLPLGDFSRRLATIQSGGYLFFQFLYIWIRLLNTKIFLRKQWGFWWFFLHKRCR